jgi:hypothetical protein
MAKRPKWLKPKKTPGEPADPVPGDPGYPFWELAKDHTSRPWLEKIPGDPCRNFTDVWIEAFEDVDRQGDQTRLVALLEEKFPMTDDAYVHFVDLLKRHQLKKKQGAPKTPSYERTETDVELDKAVGEVRELRNDLGISVKVALEQVSKSRGIPIEILAEKYKGAR